MILADAGFDAGTSLLLLRHPRFGTFARVKVGHVLTVKEGDHIFLKSVGVINCAAFDQQCEEISPKAVRGFHLRDNLPGERSAVWDAILTRKLQGLPKVRDLSRRAMLSTNKSTIALPVNKHKGKQVALSRSHISDEDADLVSTTIHKRKYNAPSIRRRLCPFIRSLTPEQVTANWPSTTSSRSSSIMPPRALSISSTSSMSSMAITKREPGLEDILHITPHGARSDVIDINEDQSDEEVNEKVNDYGLYEDEGDGSMEDEEVEVSKVWPTEFYAVDIVEGFKFIDEMAALGSIIADMFAIQFEGIPYVKTTYNDHLHRWLHAPQEAKDKALAASCTSRGLWSRFMAANLAPYAARKAAKKRLRTAANVSEETSDSS